MTNWNGRERLERFLPTILAAAARVTGTEVWVIDNGSADGSHEMCRERFPTVRFLAIGENRSFASYNEAARLCEKDVFVTLDNDVLVDEDFLPPLLRHFDDPAGDVFAVTPRIRRYPPPETGDPELFAECTRVEWAKGVLRPGDMLIGDVPLPTMYNCGCVTAWDRRKFLEIGGYDDLYFPLYYDDTDLSWRGWKRGWRCLHEPSTGVYHVCGSSLGRSEKVTTLILRNEFLFHWKNLSDPAFVAAHWSALLPRLATAAARRDLPRLRGFAQALRMSGEVARRRRQARAHFRVSDAEVVRRINGLSSPTGGDRASAPGAAVGA